jgi:hypothetical protein
MLAEKIITHTKLLSAPPAPLTFSSVKAESILSEEAERKLRRKKINYPRVSMPRQPSGYIKPPKYDFF